MGFSIIFCLKVSFGHYGNHRQCCNQKYIDAVISTQKAFAKRLLGGTLFSKARHSPMHLANFHFVRYKFYYFQPSENRRKLDFCPLNFTFYDILHSLIVFFMFICLLVHTLFKFSVSRPKYSEQNCSLVSAGQSCKIYCKQCSFSNLKFYLDISLKGLMKNH